MAQEGVRALPPKLLQDATKAKTLLTWLRNQASQVDPRHPSGGVLIFGTIRDERDINSTGSKFITADSVNVDAYRGGQRLDAVM